MSNLNVSSKQAEATAKQADQLADTISEMHAQSWALLDLINCHEDDYGSNDEMGARIVQLRHLSTILHNQLTAAKGRAIDLVDVLERIGSPVPGKANAAASGDTAAVKSAARPSLKDRYSLIARIRECRGAVTSAVQTILHEVPENEELCAAAGALSLAEGELDRCAIDLDVREGTANA